MPASPETLSVDRTQVACRPFLGFGAEWDPTFWSTWHVAQGADEAAWSRVLQRIHFMRLPLVRMMVQARWYLHQDATGAIRYDWDTPEMRSMYRHLDACQQQGITVMLTDWGIETWARAPGLQKLDEPAYADAVVACLEHLVRTRGYTCIRHFILVNEPNFEAKSGFETWAAGVRNVATRIKERKLPVTLAGTDASHDNQVWHRRGVDTLADVLGVWEFHRYHPSAEVRSGQFESFVASYWQYVRDKGHADRPMMICEAGMGDGMTASKSPHSEEFEYGLFMADYAAQATRAGTSAVLAWMLDDSSHLDFTWGMWTNVAGGQRLKAWFYPWSLLCRTIPPGSTLYRVGTPPDLRVIAAERPAADRPAGNGSSTWTLVIVNRASAARDLRLLIPDAHGQTLWRYDYKKEGSRQDANGLPLPSGKLTVLADNAAVAQVASESVLVLTTVAPD
jgi:hypothetical protein